MNKEELIQELLKKINTGEIKQEELANLLNITSIRQETNDTQPKKLAQLSMSRMFYIIGAAIIIIGIIIFISQIWGYIGSFNRIAITLGLGLIMAALGSAQMNQNHKNDIGAIFHFIGGILIPIGAVVTLIEIGGEPSSLWPITITFGVIFLFYLLLSITHKHAVLTFFAIINATAWNYLLVTTMFENQYSNNIYTYLTLIVGISYLVLAHTFREGWNKPLVGLLCFFGSAGFLSAAFGQIGNSILWELFFPLVITSSYLVSVYMKSRSILVVSTLYLIAYITFITGRYFANSLGWPITLVMIGLMFVGIAYISIKINKTYIKNIN